MAEQALSVKEVAEQLGISQRLVYEMVYQKSIPHKRLVGRGIEKGRIIFPRQMFEQWLNTPSK